MTSESQKSPQNETAPQPSAPPQSTSGPISAPKDAAPKTSGQKRWQETRGLLQQALVEWEKSELKATEVLKEAEADRSQLEDLMLKLKAKLEELS